MRYKYLTKKHKIQLGWHYWSGLKRKKFSLAKIVVKYVPPYHIISICRITYWGRLTKGKFKYAKPECVSLGPQNRLENCHEIAKVSLF